MEYTDVAEIREHPGCNVSSFQELVGLVGLLSLRNRKYDLYFRGQDKDYRDRNGKSIIYPSICRCPSGATRLSGRTIAERYKQLDAFVSLLKREQYRERYDEYYYPLLQHYELLPTPLIDITQSLRVAATFALRNDAKQGFLYVLGLPYIYGSISHFVDHNMTLVKLQHVCPANALRPRYQEGFLAGKLPYIAEKEVGDNIANRLLGKFKLDNIGGRFWDDYFQPMDDDLLFPKADVYLKWLHKTYREFIGA